MTQERVVRTLSPEEVQERCAAHPEIVLLDVREPDEWEIHHIPGAILMPMRTLTTRLSELDPEKETIVICEHGVRSQSVAQFLVAQAQFRNVGNMAGGMSAWTGPVQIGE